jgi:hypothetical protein
MWLKFTQWVAALADNTADVCQAVPVQLVLSVFALTVATLTLVLAARRLLNLGSQLVFSRLIAVGGMVAFSAGRTETVGTPRYHVRFEVGGSGVFHNVAVRLLGLSESDGLEAAAPPPARHTMSAGGDPIEWTFTVPNVEAASNAWVMVSWVRPYLEGIDSEAVAQRLNDDQLYEWRWYTEPTRFLRTGVRNLARRYPRHCPQKMRELSLYGRWRRTTSSSRIDMLGPADSPPPVTSV